MLPDHPIKTHCVLFAKVSRTRITRPGHHGTISSMDGIGEPRSIQNCNPAFLIVIHGALN